MKPYTVEFVEQKSVMTMVPIDDGYKFKPKGRAQWMQRWVWRFLHWRGALEPALEPTVTVTRHRINADNFIHNLLEQKRALLEGFNKEGRRLLIGSEDYAELMNSPEMTPHHFDFGAEVSFGRGRIVGLKVEVIPWMRGAVVMP